MNNLYDTIIDQRAALADFHLKAASAEWDGRTDDAAWYDNLAADTLRSLTANERWYHKTTGRTVPTA